MAETDKQADPRVWMYRKGEARLFASQDAVPKDEGWQDTPVPEESEPARKPRQRKAEADDDGS